MTRTFIIAALLCAAVVVGAGCGGEEERASAPKATATPAATAEATASATATGTPEGEGADKASVVIKKFAYTPKTVKVAAGAKVTWTDEDASNHTVTFTEKSIKSIDNIREGQSKTVRFEKPGTYDYICVYHPGMAGTVKVR